MKIKIRVFVVKFATFATFPPDLIRPCVLACTTPGDTVLDPFNGVGTTGLVGLEYGCKYVGIDTNAEYLDATVKRLSQRSLEFVCRP